MTFTVSPYHFPVHAARVWPQFSTPLVNLAIGFSDPIIGWLLAAIQAPLVTAIVVGAPWIGAVASRQACFKIGSPNSAGSGHSLG